VKVDYSDITELIDDDDENTDTLPSSQLSSFPMDPPPVPNREHPVSANSASDKLSKRLVTPLADMLPPEFKGADVREFFPDFKVGEVRSGLSVCLCSGVFSLVILRYFLLLMSPL